MNWLQSNLLSYRCVLIRSKLDCVLFLARYILYTIIEIGEGWVSEGGGVRGECLREGGWGVSVWGRGECLRERWVSEGGVSEGWVSEGGWVYEKWCTVIISKCGFQEWVPEQRGRYQREWWVGVINQLNQFVLRVKQKYYYILMYCFTRKVKCFTRKDKCFTRKTLDKWSFWP